MPSNPRTTCTVLPLRCTAPWPQLLQYAQLCCYDLIKGYLSKCFGCHVNLILPFWQEHLTIPYLSYLFALSLLKLLAHVSQLWLQIQSRHFSFERLVMAQMRHHLHRGKSELLVLVLQASCMVAFQTLSVIPPVSTEAEFQRWIQSWLQHKPWNPRKCKFIQDVSTILLWRVTHRPGYTGRHLNWDICCLPLAMQSKWICIF